MIVNSLCSVFLLCLQVIHRWSEKDLLELLIGGEDIETVMPAGQNQLRTNNTSSPCVLRIDDHDPDGAIGVVPDFLWINNHWFLDIETFDLLWSSSALDDVF